VFSEKELRYHNLYMDIAYRVAQMSFCKRRQVGAIAVTPYNGNIIGFGFNGTPAGECNCCEDSDGNTLPSVIHAEENLLLKISNPNNYKTHLYVTTRPCKHCARLIGEDENITHVFYKEDYHRDDGVGLSILEEYAIKVIKMK
jgi:dCMP deaminase